MPDGFVLDPPAIAASWSGNDQQTTGFEKVGDAAHKALVVIDVLDHHQAEADCISALARLDIEDVVCDEPIPAGVNVIGHLASRHRRRFVGKLDSESFVAAVTQRPRQHTGPDAYLDECLTAMIEPVDDFVDGLVQAPLPWRKETNELHV